MSNKKKNNKNIVAKGVSGATKGVVGATKNVAGAVKKNTFISEFKAFITRGNVMDMAVGVIVGGAFTSIVTSLNTDILTPILGIFGGTDFSELKVKLGEGETAPILTYGNFITAVLNFLITALVIFMIIKGIAAINNRFAKKEEPAPAEPTTKACPYCFSDIAIKATRCPHCTSILEDVVEAEIKE